MIKLTNSGGAAIYLAPAAIASIQEAGPGSAWHRIRAYVRTFDGKTYEVQQDASEINAAVEAAHQRSEA
ncbi:hypothetical protein [Achromobacter xylosoxidans]|jgi:uncharacterized protein YlzI (FlbEa/FlbD family)|uniref:hypothetical protein n=1 Tax=Alcaligenes xylosoxydans xylosoxydans TaxID=85698 RepID=UPI0006C04365|nr:hypothetical protein [Achromobacter xylosoxidans]QQE57430.1 hypothetical protein I6H41_31950 [Achromobacter xylosoxidans]QQV17069.1 hypothetical protein I6I48_14890 [Achromobacter xylosoxidans]CUI48711.1 Uncharacterised protein [Achromobacter xylosoxidans]